MNAPPQFAMARQSAGVAPRRRPASVRRTTSIDSTWPGGASEPWLMEAVARDIMTPADGSAPILLDEARYTMQVSPRREILRLETQPVLPSPVDLVGVRAGGESRSQIAASLGDQIGTPLYQILDDFAGASLVARWIWSQWLEDWRAYSESQDQQASHGRNGKMLDICTGFAEGSSALDADAMDRPGFRDPVEVGPLADPQDPAGWHEMPEQSGPAMRRARRIDVWREGEMIKVDAGFQDSGTSPRGGRRGVHEYRVHAEIDRETGAVLALQCLPLILPFPECPGASVKAVRMVNQRIGDFRNSVLEILPGTLGCTHLNDVLRALADVPVLAQRL